MRTAYNKLFRQFAWGIKEKIITVSSLNNCLDGGNRTTRISGTTGDFVYQKIMPAEMRIDITLIIYGDDNVERVSSILIEAHKDA